MGKTFKAYSKMAFGIEKKEISQHWSLLEVYKRLIAERLADFSSYQTANKSDGAVTDHSFALLGAYSLLQSGNELSKGKYTFDEAVTVLHKIGLAAKRYADASLDIINDSRTRREVEYVEEKLQSIVKAKVQAEREKDAVVKEIEKQNNKLLELRQKENVVSTQQRELLEKLKRLNSKLVSTHSKLEQKTAKQEGLSRRLEELKKGLGTQEDGAADKLLSTNLRHVHNVSSTWNPKIASDGLAEYLDNRLGRINGEKVVTVGGISKAFLDRIMGNEGYPELPVSDAEKVKSLRIASDFTNALDDFVWVTSIDDAKKLFEKMAALVGEVSDAPADEREKLLLELERLYKSGKLAEHVLDTMEKLAHETSISGPRHKLIEMLAPYLDRQWVVQDTDSAIIALFQMVSESKVRSDIAAKLYYPYETSKERSLRLALEYRLIVCNAAIRELSEAICGPYDVAVPRLDDLKEKRPTLTGEMAISFLEKFATSTLCDFIIEQVEEKCTEVSTNLSEKLTDKEAAEDFSANIESALKYLKDQKTEFEHIANGTIDYAKGHYESFSAVEVLDKKISIVCLEHGERGARLIEELIVSCADNSHRDDALSLFKKKTELYMPFMKALWEGEGIAETLSELRQKVLNDGIIAELIDIAQKKILCPQTNAELAERLLILEKEADTLCSLFNGRMRLTRPEVYSLGVDFYHMGKADFDTLIQITGARGTVSQQLLRQMQAIYSSLHSIVADLGGAVETTSNRQTGVTELAANLYDKLGYDDCRAIGQCVLRLSKAQLIPQSDLHDLFIDELAFVKRVREVLSGLENSQVQPHLDRKVVEFIGAFPNPFDRMAAVRHIFSEDRAIQPALSAFEQRLNECSTTIYNISRAVCGHDEHVIEVFGDKTAQDFLAKWAGSLLYPVIIDAVIENCYEAIEEIKRNNQDGQYISFVRSRMAEAIKAITDKEKSFSHVAERSLALAAAEHPQVGNSNFDLEVAKLLFNDGEVGIEAVHRLIAAKDNANIDAALYLFDKRTVIYSPFIYALRSGTDDKVVAELCDLREMISPRDALIDRLLDHAKEGGVPAERIACCRSVLADERKLDAFEAVISNSHGATTLDGAQIACELIVRYDMDEAIELVRMSLARDKRGISMNPIVLLAASESLEDFKAVVAEVDRMHQEPDDVRYDAIDGMRAKFGDEACEYFGKAMSKVAAFRDLAPSFNDGLAFVQGSEQFLNRVVRAWEHERQNFQLECIDSLSYDEYKLQYICQKAMQKDGALPAHLALQAQVAREIFEACSFSDAPVYDLCLEVVKHYSYSNAEAAIERFAAYVPTGEKSKTKGVLRENYTFFMKAAEAFEKISDEKIQAFSDDFKIACLDLFHPDAEVRQWVDNKLRDLPGDKLTTFRKRAERLARVVTELKRTPTASSAPENKLRTISNDYKDPPMHARLLAKLLRMKRLGQIHWAVDVPEIGKILSEMGNSLGQQRVSGVKLPKAPPVLQLVTGATASGSPSPG